MIKEMNSGKYRSIIFGALMILGMLLMCTIRVSAETIQPEPAILTTDKYDLNGDGVKDKIYEISNKGQLYWFAGLVNGTLEEMEQDTSANAVLTKNITVNQYVLDGDKNIAADANIDDFAVWTPIGTKEYPYEGQFDGLGHTIRGLYYDNNSDYAGLFGCLGVSQSSEAVTSDAAISNVHVRDSWFSALQYVGGLCGYNNYGSISRSSFDGKVRGNDDVGGLCGALTGTLTLSYNRGDVVNDGSHTGGLCGSMQKGTAYAIMNCYNTGDVLGTDFVGGICGYADDNTGGWYCYSSGNYNGTASASVKGLCGVTGGVMNSCYLGVGDAGYTKEEFANGSVACRLAGWSGVGIWGQTIGKDATPVLFGETVYTGKNVYHNHLEQDFIVDGVCTYCEQYVAEPDQINGVYQISNARELDWLSWYVGEGNTSVDAVLTADITYNTELLTKVANGDDSLDIWTPIGRYKTYQGTFDGQNHTISGLYVNDNSMNYVGLFYSAGGNAVIKNIKIADSYVYGKSYVGMISGSVRGTVENCHSSGIVGGASSVGGICGENNGGTIVNCSNQANVVHNESAYVRSPFYAGGVTGYNRGSISRCFNTGTVTAGSRYAGGISGIEDNTDDKGSSITCCYNTGEITADAYAGGISGGYRVTISHSYNTGTVNGASWASGAIYAYDSNNSGTSRVTNCYYLEGSCNRVDPDSKSKSLQQFKSGEVTFLLNRDDSIDASVWFQNIDNGFESNDYPSFSGGSVYSYTDETTNEEKYTNRVPDSHTFEYSVDETNGAVITETCTHCEHSATATLKMDPSKNTIYTGEEIEPAMVAYSSNWQGGALAIAYENNKDISENEAAATISIGGVTAALSFGIQEHELFYAINGTAITEKCKYCAHKATARLTLDSEADLTYTGKAITPVKVVKSDDWQGGDLPIAYENNTYVTEQGATAKITEGNVTATLTFMITRANRKAPQVSPVPETIQGKGDGKISGLTTDMEWSVDGIRYKEVTSPEMEFAVGTYHIRYQESENQSRSEATKVTLEKGEKLLAVKIPEDIVPAFTLKADKTKLRWRDTVTLQLTGPINECSSCTLKVNDKVISDYSLDDTGKTYTYTISEVQEDLTIKLEINDKIAPNVKFISGSKEPNLGFAEYEIENAEVVLFYKNQTDFFFRIEDVVSGVKSVEYLLSEQNFAEEKDVAGEWKELTQEENGLYKISCPSGTKGYNYLRVTDNEENQKIVNTPKIVIYEDSVLNTAQLTYQKVSGTDQSFAVNLKGNTVKEIYLGNVRINPTNYTVSASGTVTLKKAYLETLAVQTTPYQLRVEYNPQGETYGELGEEVIGQLGIEYTNEAPKDTILNLTVKNQTTAASKPASSAPIVSSAQRKKNSVKIDTGTTVVWKKSKFTVKWGKVSGASGYDIFAVLSGKSMTAKSLVKTVKGQKRAVSFTKLGGKKPVSNKVYKLQVKAYKLVKGKKVYIGSSRVYYVIRNDNKKYTNAAKVTVKKKSVTLKKGKTSQIKASIKKQSKSKKLLSKSYGPSLRYYSTNTSIAAVTSKGKIKAKKKGKCYIYVTALNGVHTRVKVTVK